MFQEFSAVFDEIADPYLRERKGDVADLVGRLKMNLRPGMATPRDLLRELDEASVLIADELTPSLVAQIDWTQGARVRHRRRQPDVSLGDSRALARGARPSSASTTRAA